MFKWMNSWEAHAELEAKAQRLIISGDRAGLKRLFSELSAAAQMQEGTGAAAGMRQALQDEILRMSRSVKRGWFDDFMCDRRK